MIWQSVGKMGKVEEPFRAGKFMVNGVWKYRLWKDNELIGDFPTFEAAQNEADRIREKDEKQ